MSDAGASPRSLVIGIDGASFRDIDPLIKRGRLPTIARLLRDAASAPTTTTWPAHTAPGWSSFISACKPGGHGIYQFFDTQDANHAATVTTADRLGRSSMWDWLAAQGQTLGLVNIPMSHPPRDLPGYQVTWPLEHTMHFCRPRGLLAELARERAPFASDLTTMFRGDMNYLSEAEGNVVARARSTAHLMRTRPTDVVMVVFTEVDRVGHHYWHYQDPTHPLHEPSPDGSGWHRALERAYTAVDEAVAELLALVDEDTVVVLVSDHGLGTGRYTFPVHSLLEEHGLLATREATGSERTASWFTEQGRIVDFERTQVYLPVPGSYGLNVNLAGRQTGGVVAERDRERVLDEAAALLREVELPEGGRMLREVVPREVAYPGPHRDAAPDLLLIPHDESVLVTPGLGAAWAPSWQTGLHRYAGMWAQVSRNVRPGRLPHAIDLTCAAPTLLADLGLSWSSSVGGEPLYEVLAPGVPIPGPHPDVERVDAMFEPPVRGGGGGAAHEDEFTRVRLREMGYI